MVLLNLQNQLVSQNGLKGYDVGSNTPFAELLASTAPTEKAIRRTEWFYLLGKNVTSADLLLFSHVFSVLSLLRQCYQYESREVDIELLLMNKMPAVGQWYNQLSIQDFNSKVQ